MQLVYGIAENPGENPNCENVDGWEPFPVELLPQPVQGFVVAGANAIGCDPSYIALPVLASTAAAIGNSRCIRLKRGWTEPAILWTANVGPSGTAKSPALELPLRPVRDRQRQAMKEHAQDMKQHEADVLRYERDLNRWKRAKDDTDPPTKPKEPTAKRCWADDTTVEALAVLLRDNPRGLLLARDELSAWFDGFDRYVNRRGGDAAKWLEMHGGRSVVVDRKTGADRTIYVPRAAMSVTGAIQPDTLRRVLTPEYRANGMAARLLFTYSPRRPKQWTEADVLPEVEQI